MARHSTPSRQYTAGTFVRILSLMIAALFFSACVDVEIGSQYRLDGSATHSIQISVPQTPGEAVDPEQIEDFLGDLQQQANDAGFEFARTVRDGVITVRITGTTSESEDAGASINGLINATGLNAAPGVTAPFRGTFARETEAVGGTVYILDLTVDGELLFESVALPGPTRREAELRDALTVHYVATLPGDITETTGRQINESTVRWEIPASGETELDATSSTGGSGSAALFIILGLVAIGVVIIIALVLGWYFARRDRLANALGGALHRLPGQRTITTEGAWIASKISGLTHRLNRNKRDHPEDGR